MKFKIQVGDFSRKLGLVQGISERRATMPVLSHVLITLKNNKIEKIGNPEDVVNYYTKLNTRS